MRVEFSRVFCRIPEIGSGVLAELVDMWSVYKVDMWSVCARYVVGNVVTMRSVYGRYMVGIRSMHGRYVLCMWSVYGRYKIGIMSIYGRYVIGMRSVYGR